MPSKRDTSLRLFPVDQETQKNAPTPRTSAEKAEPPSTRSALEGLNEVQRKAATATDGPTLIVAGAGSGKTRVLTCRVAHLLEKGVEPWRVLALTFTNKAAREMRQRVGRLVGDARAAKLWMGTFHSIFSRILRREAQALGYTATFTIYDTDDSVRLIKDIMSTTGISPQDFPPKMVRGRISSAKNSLVTPGRFRSDARNQRDERIAHVYERYEERLKTNNAMDFDDLLVKTIRLFTDHEDLLRKWQKAFGYVLIDEYQDTNRAQYQVVQMLAGEHKNICVVGDDAQSIYRFRGADIRNMLDFEKDYPDHEIFRLEQNYRSTKMILGAADDVIKRNVGQIKKTLWTDNPEGDPIDVLTLRDERDEGADVERIIRENVDRGMSFSQVAVLFRTNAQSLSIEEALRRRGIPYTVVGGVSFYQRAEIKDAVAYLRLLVNPHDDESFLRAVNRPARGIGDVTVRRLRTAAENAQSNLIDMAAQADLVTDLTPRARKSLKSFADDVARWRELLGDGRLADVARDVLTESGLLVALHDEGTTESMSRWENVQTLLSHLAEYSDENPDAGLDSYLQDASLASDVDSYDQNEETVTLMTIHSAKGLEFDVVIVPGMEEGLFPVGQTATDQDDLEEERRLFYVAVTRARKRLYLTNCERRYRFGELSYPSPSRFLSEISDQYVRFNSTSPRRSAIPRLGARRSDPSRTRRLRESPDTVVPQEHSSFTPDPEPDDDFSQIQQPLQVGTVVVHQQFGKGRVVSLQGAGEKTRVEVQFATVGKKKLMLKFARLKVV